MGEVCTAERVEMNPWFKLGIVKLKFPLNINV